MPHLGRLTLFYFAMFVLMSLLVWGILWLVQTFLGVEISTGAGAAAPMISAMLAGQMFHRWEGRRPRTSEGLFFALLFGALTLLISLVVIWAFAWDILEEGGLSDPVFWAAVGIVTVLNFLSTWFFIHFGARQNEKYGSR